MSRILGVALLFSLAACGRAAPGSTLARRKDPDVAAHDVTKRQCSDLEYHKYATSRHPPYPPNESFECTTRAAI